MRRVLQVVMSLDTGGVETWLLHVLRAIDRSRFAFDFAVVREDGGVYEEEVRRLGARVFRIGGERQPLRLARGVHRVLGAAGPYDVVHGHLHHLSGPALAAAAARGVPRRISHSHNDSRSIDGQGSWLRKGYRATLKAAVARFGTHHLAVSDKAAISLHGRGWAQRPNVTILPCALDFAAFARDPAPLRPALGISDEAPVFGTVGRLAEEKNQAFLLEVLRELLPTLPEARLLLAGDGPERPRLEGLAATWGLGERVHFLGQRQDVADVLAAMDVFLFPSHFEGLGLAAIESQAAGVPALISSGVSEEVVVVPELVRRMELAAGAAAWAEAARGLLGRRWDRREALRLVECSPYGMEAHLPQLLRAYGVRDG